MPNARLTFNINNWTRPSGPYGKSTHSSAYESHFGFGWEEWLMCDRHHIDGYQYGHIDGFRYVDIKKYKLVENIGRIVRDLDLYTFERIKASGTNRFWVGAIKELILLDAEDTKLFWRKKIIQNPNPYIQDLKENDTKGKKGIGEIEFRNILKNNGIDPVTKRGLFNVKFKRSDIQLNSRDNWVLDDNISYNRYRIWR